MPIYRAPVEDVLFLANDVFHVERYANLPGFADASSDVVEAILAEAAKFCESTLAPLNQVGDVQGCRRDDQGRVTTPDGFKEAYRQYVEGGWIGISVADRSSAARACRSSSPRRSTNSSSPPIWPSRCIRP